MSKTIEAVFDGKVLRPKDALTLEPNTRVRITIEPLEPTTKDRKSTRLNSSHIQKSRMPSSA